MSYNYQTVFYIYSKQSQSYELTTNTVNRSKVLKRNNVQLICFLVFGHPLETFIVNKVIIKDIKLDGLVDQYPSCQDEQDCNTAGHVVGLSGALGVAVICFAGDVTYFNRKESNAAGI